MWKCPKCGREFKKNNQSHFCGEPPKTVKEYIMRQDSEKQADLFLIREILQQALPEAKERISWGMPTYWENHNILHFAASKKHIGIYPGSEAVEEFKEELKKYHIEPLVTIFHYDLPVYLEEEMGGWLNRELIDCYEKYARVLFEEYKGLVKYWLTFNEINSALMIPAFMPDCPPSRVRDALQILHHQFVASARAVRAAHEIDLSMQVGAMLAGGCTYPLTCDPQDVLLAQKQQQDDFYYCSDTMVRGEYPYFAQRLWKEWDAHIEMAEQDPADLKQGTVDMITFSYYSSSCASADPNAQRSRGNFTRGAKNPYLRCSEWGWSIDPKGLQYFLNEIYARYQLPVMVVENGLGAADTLEEDHTIHDPYRIAYTREHIKAMEQAVADGVDLRAYTYWGCIDLVSASTGEMKKRYGFIYVDKNDDGSGSFERYKKDSFYWYKKVIGSNGDDLD